MNMRWTEQPNSWERTLTECEVVIARGLDTFVEVGLALLEIRDRRLYREQGYERFEDYCRERWRFSRVHAHRMIEAAEVAAMLPIGNTPTNESQARELVPIKDDPEAIAGAWQEVQQQAVEEARATGEPVMITAAAVREVVARRLTKPQAEAHAERRQALAVRAAEEAHQRADVSPYDRIVCAEARVFLRDCAANGDRAHVCLTSPPYWAKRTYGDGSEEIGQEPTPEAYIAHIVEVCDLIGEVLTEDGWLFLNLGDTYATLPGQYRGDPDRVRGISAKAVQANGSAPARRDWGAVPEKSLCLIPWRVALLLVERGWRVRNLNIWHKLGHQPENVFDRSAQAWEPVLQLTRAQHAYYDRAAGDDDLWAIPVGRRGKAGAHPAVFPEALVERVISRACPPGGVMLDPFAGSGTVLQVAQRMGRRFLGCDLYDWVSLDGR